METLVVVEEKAKPRLAAIREGTPGVVGDWEPPFCHVGATTGCWKSMLLELELELD